MFARNFSLSFNTSVEGNLQANCRLDVQQLDVQLLYLIRGFLAVTVDNRPFDSPSTSPSQNSFHLVSDIFKKSFSLGEDVVDLLHPRAAHVSEVVSSLECFPGLFEGIVLSLEQPPESLRLGTCLSKFPEKLPRLLHERPDRFQEQLRES